MWYTYIYSNLKVYQKCRDQGVFEVKRRVKTWQVRGIWSQQLEHKQVLQQPPQADRS